MFRLAVNKTTHVVRCDYRVELTMNVIAHTSMRSLRMLLYLRRAIRRLIRLVLLATGRCHHWSRLCVCVCFVFDDTFQ